MINIQRNIRALYIKENALPEEVFISNTLTAKQEKVDGLIEYVRLLDDEEIILICNEEGKINGMGPNRDIGYDIVFGPFLIAGEDSEIGEDRSLTDEQISKYKKKFNEKSIDNTMAKYETIINSKLNNYEL